MTVTSSSQSNSPYRLAKTMSLHTPASASSSSKRKRAESDTHTDDTPPQPLSLPLRSTEFWFEDGNVVIQAQRMQFRVYRGSLARQSQVFRSMFGLPQPEAQILLEACPIVHVDDVAQDWEHLFGVLYNPETVYGSCDTLALPVFSSLLRLGRKYALDKLYDLAVQRIKKDIPKSLEEWDVIFGPDSKNKTRFDGKEVELLNILLEMNIQSFLPVAYFLCIKNLSLENIFRQPTCEDRTVSHLSPDSVEKLICSRDRIYKAMVTHKYSWLGNYDPCHNQHCLDPRRCQNQRLQMLILFSRGGVNPNLVSKALQRKVEQFRDMFCSKCGDEITAAYDTGRQKIWDELPNFFDLPSWKELK